MPLILLFYCSLSARKLSENYIDQALMTLDTLLTRKGLRFHSDAFIRIFKEEKELEVWLEKHGKMHYLKTYPICEISGDLGPKEKEGDRQAPEGVYCISEKGFNLSSKFHLSIAINYPNGFDRLKKRTGGDIVIHGYCASVGCFAIENEPIEELYGLLLSSIKMGQKDIQVHIFPFKLTSEAIKAHMGIKEDREWILLPHTLENFARMTDTPLFKYDKHHSFWINIKSIYDYFEKNHTVPVITYDKEGYRMKSKGSR